jgi:hypothetical protein
MVMLRSLVIALLLTLAAPPLWAGEFRVGIGAMMFFEDGLDLHISYRPERSAWQYGLRYLRYTEEFDYGGVTLSETTYTLYGPTLSYLFSPESRHSWYLGASVYYWEQLEKSTRTGTRGKDSTTTVFFGGGRTGKIGEKGFYDLGILLTPKTLSTQTADGSEESSGVDIRLQLGFAF